MRNRLKEVFTSKVLHFGEPAGVRHHMLSFNVEEAEIEMMVGLVIHFHDKIPWSHDGEDATLCP